MTEKNCSAQNVTDVSFFCSEDGVEDDAAWGGGAGGGGAGGDDNVRSWSDDDEDGEGQCRPEGAERAGTGSSTARPSGGGPADAPGVPKRRAEGLFGNRRPKKAKQMIASERQEATKTAAIRRAPKERPMVSG